MLEKNRGIKLNKTNEKIFYNNLNKIGYMTKEKENIKNRKLNNYVVKAFQRRFRQELINGKADTECLIISRNLLKKLI